MKIISKAGFTLLVLPLLLFVSAGSSNRTEASLNWSLGLLHVQSGDMLQFISPVQSSTGEKFRIVISPESTCFAYVVYESPHGDMIDVIYAGQIKKDETWYSSILEIILPGGLESFYIIVSLEEQKILTERISELKQGLEQRTESSPLAESSQKLAVMNEIFRLQAEVSQVKEEPPRPALMGGATRGTPGRNRGMEFSGLSIYVKTINIEH